MTRTLLLTQTTPGPQGVGGIILKELSGLFAKQTLCTFLVVKPWQNVTLPEEFSDAEVKFGTAKYERASQIPSPRVWHAVGAVQRSFLFRRHCERLVNEAVEFASAEDVNAVWAVLDAPTSIALAEPVARALGVPLYCMVWDDIEHNVRYFRLDRLAANKARSNFSSALRAASGVAVIGETMQAEYQSRYGVSSVVVRHGIDESLLKPVGVEPQSGSVLRIGFAGTVSARSAFSNFLKGLDERGWHIGDRTVHLILVGHRFDLSTNRAAHIEYLGWRSNAETIELLSSCDVNYLPQPFEPEMSSFSRLSFPTKLTTYLAAGRPVLLHAPDGASLPRFFKEYAFGAWCKQLSGETVTSMMEELVSDDAKLSRAADAVERARRSVLSRKVFLQQFKLFMSAPDTNDPQSTLVSAGVT